MRFSQPELILDARAFLGEGPAWDAARERLSWIDIHAGHLHCFDPHTLQDQVIDVGQVIGCAAPTRSGKVIMGLRNSIATLDFETTMQTVICNLESHLLGNRFNDGKCAPNGRFVAGTMDNAEVEASGTLYSLGSDGVLTNLLQGIRISNGLTWSPDQQTMYYIDTPTRQVMAYDYDLDNGIIANPRVAINIPSQMGWPDGMTSDMNGRLWVALWGGAALSVWNPLNGSLLEKIAMPAKNVTACVFGGMNRDQLFITSARKGLDTGDLTSYPASGGLFQIQTNLTGNPTFYYDDIPQN